MFWLDNVSNFDVFFGGNKRLFLILIFSVFLSFLFNAVTENIKVMNDHIK